MKISPKKISDKSDNAKQEKQEPFFGVVPSEKKSLTKRPTNQVNRNVTGVAYKFLLLVMIDSSSARSSVLSGDVSEEKREEGEKLEQKQQTATSL